MSSVGKGERVTKLDRNRGRVFLRGGIGGGTENLIDGIGNLDHFGLPHSPRCNGGCTKPDAAGLKGTAGFAGDGVFVGRDVGGVEGVLGDFPGQIRIGTAQVNQDEMVIGSAADKTVSPREEGIGEGGRVANNLFLVGSEFGFESFAKADGFGGDDMHERAALGSGKYGRVNLFGVLGLTENQSATGATEGLVGGRGDEVGMGDGRGVNPGGDKSGDVGNVGEEESTDGAGNLTHAGKVDCTGVGGGTNGDHFRFFSDGGGGNLVVVDPTRFGIDAVIDNLIQFSAEIHRVTVGEVTPVGEIHGENPVAWLEGCEVDSSIGLTAGMGLNIGMVGPEEFLCPFDGEHLGLVDGVTASIIPFGGIAFGIFVREDRSSNLHHGGVGEIFGGNQLEVALLPGEFLAHDGGDLGVADGDGIGIEGLVGFNRGCCSHGFGKSGFRFFGKKFQEVGFEGRDRLDHCVAGHFVGREVHSKRVRNDPVDRIVGTFGKFAEKKCPSFQFGKPVEKNRKVGIGHRVDREGTGGEFRIQGTGAMVGNVDPDLTEGGDRIFGDGIAGISGDTSGNHLEPGKGFACPVDGVA